MGKMYSCLVFIGLLLLGISPAFPAEDLPDTAYDESETQPYEGALPISSPIAQIVSANQTASLIEFQAIRAALPLQTSIPFQQNAKLFTRTDARRFSGARDLLTRVCTLLY